VLVVDDNVDGAEMLATLLGAKGYDARIAHDGPAGLAVADTFRPDVALLDIGLPVMDGYELARRLRELDAGVKLIAVTGYSQPGDFARTKEAGFAAHLVKPISLDAVQAEIERLAS
jgi:CheY-like chemotaxis protein